LTCCGEFCCAQVQYYEQLHTRISQYILFYFFHNGSVYPLYADFTPSRGSTPNYQPRTQTVMTNVFQPGNVQHFKSSEPSPTGRKKLAELLQESMHNGSEESTDISKSEKQQTQSGAADGKPVSESSSTSSTEPTPTRAAKSQKERSWYTGHCCLPSFVHSLSLDESQNRQKMNPGPCAV
jgi:hypothetical protein